ncbi:hypothetical protein CF111_01735 [Aeromonas sobria]|jgi:hypothetical protein|nr:hypothetical protein CF111_01735 [Aeromonas sobria]
MILWIQLRSSPFCRKLDLAPLLPLSGPFTDLALLRDRAQQRRRSEGAQRPTTGAERWERSGWNIHMGVHIPVAGDYLAGL